MTAPSAAARTRFERVSREVYEPLQRYLLRRTDPDTAQDVLSDALLVLWRRIDDVPEEAVLPWAYGVARRCLANARRSADRQEQLVVRLAAQRSPGDLEPSYDEGLSVALAAASDADRELLRLWAWEQLSPREIALVLGISANAVSIRLHRALRRLRSALPEQRKSGPAAGQVTDRQGEEADR